MVTIEFTEAEIMHVASDLLNIPGMKIGPRFTGAAKIIREARILQASIGRRAPLQATKGYGPAGTIEWSEHVEAWEAYHAKHHNSQTAERIAERGGFGHAEVEELLGHRAETFEED